jgi:hypothetical protein
MLQNWGLPKKLKMRKFLSGTVLCTVETWIRLSLEDPPLSSNFQIQKRVKSINLERQCLQKMLLFLDILQTETPRKFYRCGVIKETGSYTVM